MEDLQPLQASTAMSGRHRRNERNNNLPGRGHHRQLYNRDLIQAPSGGTSKTSAGIISKFLGLNTELPTLDYGSLTNNKPVEFLRRLGEHCAVTYKAPISEAFLSVPPAYGDSPEGPEYPDIDPDADLTHVERSHIQVWLNDQRNWSAEELRLKNDKLKAFAVVYGQLSESSRCEIEDDAGWTEAFSSRDLIYLISRIRATHIAVQSGNLQQDQERVRTKWYNMRMSPSQSSYSFRREVDDYQMERMAVGLEPIPEGELVIGILNRIDQARYGHVRLKFLENQRLNVGIFPDRAEVIWKEIK